MKEKDLNGQNRVREICLTDSDDDDRSTVIDVMSEMEGGPNISSRIVNKNWSNTCCINKKILVYSLYCNV